MALPERWCRMQGVTLFISGELTHATADEFVAEVFALSALPDILHVELQGFEIDDAVAAVAAVNALRWLAQRRRLIVHTAPQVLAHNLYRVGDLAGGTLVLEATREDEPYG